VPVPVPVPRARCIPSPARPSRPSPWGLFLIRPSQNKPTPPPISPFRPGKRRAPDIGPPYRCTPRCVPPPESPHANSHKPVGLRIHPPSLNQPAPSNPSRWHHLFSPSPKKVSDTTREIRIVAAPAHLLPPHPSEIGRLQHRAAKGPPGLLPSLPVVLFFSPVTTATRLAFHAGPPSTGYPGEDGLLAQPLPFHPSCFILSDVCLPTFYSLLQSKSRREATSFFLLLFLLIVFVYYRKPPPPPPPPELPAPVSAMFKLGFF